MCAAKKKIFSKIGFNFIENSFVKVFNSKEVGEVQEGADCYCDKKLSKNTQTS